MISPIILGAIRAIDEYRALRREVLVLRARVAELEEALDGLSRDAAAGAELAEGVTAFLTDAVPLSGLQTRLARYRGRR